MDKKRTRQARSKKRKKENDTRSTTEMHPWWHTEPHTISLTLEYNKKKESKKWEKWIKIQSNTTNPDLNNRQKDQKRI